MFYCSKVSIQYIMLKPRKKLAPTLVTTATATAAARDTAPIAATLAFQQAAQKKNPLENAADLIALRYGVLGDAPQISEDVFAKNRATGKKVVPLKEYFEQTAKEFAQNEAVKKEEVVRKKRENAKLTPCQRKFNTLQRNIEGYIEVCDPLFSNESIIEMMDTARAKVAVKKTRRKTNARKRRVSSSKSSLSKSKKGGRKR